MTVGFQCLKCRHIDFGKGCDAFPDGIPYDILSGQVDHSKPYPGDNGIRFEERKEE